MCVCDLETPEACIRGGEGAAALSPSLPASVGGGSNASEGGRGSGFSLPFVRAVELRVGVPEVCSNRDDQDEGIAFKSRALFVHIFQVHVRSWVPGEDVPALGVK